MRSIRWMTQLYERATRRRVSNFAGVVVRDCTFGNTGRAVEDTDAVQPVPPLRCPDPEWPPMPSLCGGG